MTIFKRILSFLLVLVMMAGMLPATAYAMEAEEPVAEEMTAPVEENFTEPEAEETVPEETSAPTEAVEETEAPAEEQVTEPEAEEETVPPETTAEAEETIQVTDDVASAATISGTCGMYLTWTLNSKGVLTISGVGGTDHYASEKDTPWAAYAD